LAIGQFGSAFADPDAYPETVDLGGTTSQGRARSPQIRYTYPLPYGMSLALAAENPDSDFAGPLGGYRTDTNGIPSSGNCAALTQASITAATLTSPANLTTTAAATNISNLCTGGTAFFNAAQNLMPDFVLRGRLEQPWGHIQITAILRDITLNDGLFVRKSWIGYGSAISGNFFTWGKDNFVWRAVIGEGIGEYLGNAAGAVATNFGGALVGQSFNATDSRSFFTSNRALYDSVVSGSTITAFSGGVAYQHWWTAELRSTVDVSMSHSDVSAYYLQASGRNANNKELTIAHANLLWSPVAFVDLGAEGAWGHRVVVSGLKGDSWTLQTMMRVRF
jgi:hypothetical protein